MNQYQRQIVLLVGFMTLLAAVILFLFVYAPNPVDKPSLAIGLPQPLGGWVDASLEGWEALMSDIGAAKNATMG